MASSAVLPVVRVRRSGPTARAWIGAAASVLTSNSNIKAETGPFGTAERQQDFRVFRIGGRLAGGGQYRSRRQRLPGRARLQNLAVRKIVLVASRSTMGP